MSSVCACARLPEPAPGGRVASQQRAEGGGLKKKNLCGIKQQTPSRAERAAGRGDVEGGRRREDVGGGGVVGGGEAAARRSASLRQG